MLPTVKLLDAKGWALLGELQRDARLSFAELGRRVGLSTPAVAERVRKAVAALGIEVKGKPLRTSVSVGVAQRVASMADVDALIKQADEGVYLAKSAGRNRVAAVQAGERRA